MTFPRFPGANPFLPGPAGDPLFMFRPAINAWENALRFSNSSKPAPGTPIDIRAQSKDEGLQMTAGADRVTLTGQAKGSDRPDRDIYDAFERGGRAAPKTRGVKLSLDLDQAPTQNVWGETDYTEKNQRSFYVGTRAGESAKSVAERLAAKINEGDDFRAAVNVQGGSATLNFTRR